MENNVLEIKNLHVRFDTDDAKVYAVNGVNLSLPKQKTLGLVGETGAGKSMVIDSILAILYAYLIIFNFYPPPHPMCWPIGSLAS